jgi:type I restriction enzyme, S subunit
LRSELFRQYVDRVGRSAAQPNINSKELARFRFPLPTISEQYRIAALFRQLDAVGQSGDDFSSRLRVICDNQFIELFGHPALNPKGFPVKPLAELGSVDRGVSRHRPRDAAHLYGGPYPFVQTGDVANAGDWITAYSSTYSQAGLLQSKLWPRGTLCITIAANIGDAAILDFDACFPDSIVGFTPNEEMTSEYVLYCIRSYQQYFKTLAPQAAQKNINLETLRPLRLPVPPPDVQQKFHRFLLAVRVVSGEVAKRSTRIDDLRREFALASFRGELTETWRAKNSESIQQEAETRKRARPLSALARVEFEEEQVPAEREIQLYRPERVWLLEQLSDFQQRVRLTLLTEWRGTLIAGDPEALDAFCRHWPVEDDKDRRDQIRRALQQLAALGLIAKVSVKQTQDDGEVLFVDGFRPLRDEEVSLSRDYEALKPLLRAAGSEA